MTTTPTATNALTEALQRIAALDYANGAVNCAALDAVKIAKEALATITAPGIAFELAGYVNGDELDNMLDDRAAVVQGAPNGFRKTPIYRAAPGIAPAVRADADALKFAGYWDTDECFGDTVVEYLAGRHGADDEAMEVGEEFAVSATFLRGETWRVTGTSPWSAERIGATPPAAEAEQPVDAPQDHEVRELINQLRDVATSYHATQQLRSRIAGLVTPFVRRHLAGRTPQPPEPAPQPPEPTPSDASPGAWHQAMLDECMRIESAYCEADPAKTLQDIITWHTQAAVEDHANTHAYPADVTEPPGSSQDWAALGGAEAFHLINRFAEGWDGVGSMMEAWRAARTPPPVQPVAQTGDPKLQELFSATIDGALTFGYQGNNPPPEGHWLTMWWNKGRASAEAEQRIGRNRDMWKSQCGEQAKRLTELAPPAEALGDRSITETADEVIARLENLACTRPYALPSMIEAFEFRRNRYGLNKQQWAKVLGITSPNYSDFVHGRRGLPRLAMQRAARIGVPAEVLLHADCATRPPATHGVGDAT